MRLPWWQRNRIKIVIFAKEITGKVMKEIERRIKRLDLYVTLNSIAIGINAIMIILIILGMI